MSMLNNYFSHIKHAQLSVCNTMDDVKQMKCVIVTMKNDDGIKQQSYLIKNTFLWSYNKFDETINIVFCLSGLVDAVITRKNCIKPKFDNLLCTLNLVFREERYKK
jgi:hypothetical protein